ncbi:MAG: hypothetical protein A2X81_11930 [Desulfobacterales bacterium GWB2_56_26]|nr:MAG: hypothetical protein A2X81_11930 [Desulfobacterales bacterium GWB2_56_26]
MPAKRPRYLPDLLCDSHVHTRFCGHATGEMEEYVQAAISHGLRKIVFLEHMEEGILTQAKTWLSEEDFDRYFVEGRRLREQYGSQIEIGLGVECGYNEGHGEALLTRLGKRQWDRIGISCHFIKLPGVPEHLNMFSKQAENIDLARRFGPERILDRYLALLHQAIRQLPGTFVCHLDAALRRVPGITLTADHYRMIDGLLRTMKEKGMALELNTSGLDMRGEPFPTRRILSMALACDIPLVLGSDAHKPADVARHFADIAGFIPSPLESCP